MPLDAHRNDFPNIPPRLISAIRKAGSERKFAWMQDINIRYVSDLLRKGIEPTDRTEKGRAVRSKLYLPKTKRKRIRHKRTPLQKAISRMVRATGRVMRERTL